MVKYDFKCQKCKKKFTVEAHMGDVTVPDCPKCGSKGPMNVIRVFVPTDFYFHSKDDLQTQMRH
jgi:putative FmdB family regulatory protein